MTICSFYDVMMLLCFCTVMMKNGTLLQEHQENILGNTMQSVVALLNNLVACKGSNMKLLYEQGKCFLEFILIMLNFLHL